MCGELYIHPPSRFRTPNEVIQVLCFGTAFRKLVLHPLPQGLYYRSVNRKIYMTLFHILEEASFITMQSPLGRD